MAEGPKVASSKLRIQQGSCLDSARAGMTVLQPPRLAGRQVWIDPLRRALETRQRHLHATTHLIPKGCRSIHKSCGIATEYHLHAARIRRIYLIG